jgi:hypothetical protein
MDWRGKVAEQPARVVATRSAAVDFLSIGRIALWKDK